MRKGVGRLFSALVLSFSIIALGTVPGTAVTVPAPHGDNPVYIPGTPYPASSEEDAARLAALDSAFIDDITAGDTPLSVESAAASRSNAAGKAKTFPVGTNTFNSTWAPLGPSPIGQVQRTTGALTAESGRIGALTILPNGRFVLGAAQGGVWTMDPGTGVWVARTDNLPSLSSGALAYAPSSPAVVYDGTGEGALSGDSYFGNGILKSTDGGTTWSHVSGDFFIGVAISHAAGQSPVLYAGFDWYNAGTTAHRGSRVVKSTDGGATWTLPGTGSGIDSVLGYCGTQCTYDNVIESDPTNPNVVFAAGSFGYTLSPPSGGVYRSDDGGVHWKNLGADQHPDFHALAFDPNNSRNVLIGSDGGVWSSPDQGGRVPGSAGETNLLANHWVDLNGNPDLSSNGLQITQFSSIST